MSTPYPRAFTLIIPPWLTGQVEVWPFTVREVAAPTDCDMCSGDEAGPIYQGGITTGHYGCVTGGESITLIDGIGLDPYGDAVQAFTHALYQPRHLVTATA